MKSSFISKSLAQKIYILTSSFVIEKLTSLQHLAHAYDSYPEGYTPACEVYAYPEQKVSFIVTDKFGNFNHTLNISATMKWSVRVMLTKKDLKVQGSDYIIEAVLDNFEISPSDITVTDPYGTSYVSYLSPEWFSYVTWYVKMTYHNIFKAMLYGPDAVVSAKKNAKETSSLF